MGAPIGSKNALGNSGGKPGLSGRKSAFQENARAEFLWKVFEGEYSKDELEGILKGKHSIKDKWIVEAVKGNEKFIHQIIHKLFPDGLEIRGGITHNIQIDDQRYKEILNLERERIGQQADNSAEVSN